MAGVGVIVNPHAKANRTVPERVARLREIVGGDGTVVQTNGIPDLDHVASEFFARNVDLVAVCGGDGTLFRSVSAFRRVWGEHELPLVVPLRAGTINVVAASIGAIGGRPEKVLAHVLRDYRHGRTHDVVERDTVCVNGTYSGFLFGLGVIVNFLRTYYAEPDPGPVSAARLVARMATSAIFGTSLARAALRPYEADVICDGERVPFRRFTMMLAMTIEHLPLGFRVGYLANRMRGHFHVLTGPISGARMVGNLHRFRWGLPVRDEGLYDGIARDVRIEFERPTHYMVDADILDPVSSIHLTPGPRVRLVRG